LTYGDPALEVELTRDPALAAAVLKRRTRKAALATQVGTTHGPPPGTPVRRRPRFAPWFSLALLGLAGGMFVRDLIEPHASEAGTGQIRRILPGETSPARLVVRLPEPRVDAFGTFAFEGPRPPDGWFSIEIRGADDPADAAPLLRLERTEGLAWTPTGTELAALPPAIAVTVRAFDAVGTEVASTTARSRREWP